MFLTDSASLVLKARENGYGVPALNTNGATYDITRAIIETAEELDSPLIVQCYEPNLAYRGADYFVDLVKRLADRTHIPIAIQLDHGKTEVSVMSAIRAGFTTVMIDNAWMPYTDNVTNTKKVIKKAHALGIPVEAEIGNILCGAENEDTRTCAVKYEIALRYSRDVKPDLLAVALGTTHGIFKEQTCIDLDLLHKIAGNCETPLVLHGTCGIPMELITECVKEGISKVNFGETLRLAYINHLRTVIQDFDHQCHPWRIMQESKNRLKSEVGMCIVACGAQGRASDWR